MTGGKSSTILVVSYISSFDIARAHAGRQVLSLQQPAPWMILSEIHVIHACHMPRVSKPNVSKMSHVYIGVPCSPPVGALYSPFAGE